MEINSIDRNLYIRNDHMDYRSLMAASGNVGISAAKEQAQENYDTLTIHSGFLSSMAQSAAAIDGNDTVSQRILFLRQQVASGTYQMDSQRIAECMLQRRSQPGIF